MDKVKVCTPISHLFQNPEYANKIILNSDNLEYRDHSEKPDLLNQEVYHCDIQPIHEFNASDYSLLNKIKTEHKNLKLISFHLASCYKEPKLLNNVFYPNGKKIKKKELIENAQRNITFIKNFFNNSVKIAVENNNHLLSEAYDYVTDPQFINKIVNDNEIYFLFDISHARISSYNLNLDYRDYILNLPLERIIQIHLSKEIITPEGLMYDAHEIPDHSDLLELKRLIKKYKGIKYVTVEYYKNMDVLLNFLVKLKKMIYEG